MNIKLRRALFIAVGQGMLGTVSCGKKSADTQTQTVSDTSHVQAAPPAPDSGPIPRRTRPSDTVQPTPPPPPPRAPSDSGAVPQRRRPDR